VVTPRVTVTETERRSPVQYTQRCRTAPNGVGSSAPERRGRLAGNGCLTQDRTTLFVSPTTGFYPVAGDPFHVFYTVPLHRSRRLNEGERKPTAKRPKPAPISYFKSPLVDPTPSSLRTPQAIDLTSPRTSLSLTSHISRAIGAIGSLNPRLAVPSRLASNLLLIYLFAAIVCRLTTPSDHGCFQKDLQQVPRPKRHLTVTFHPIFWLFCCGFQFGLPR
jgi:hypothetical protein